MATQQPGKDQIFNSAADLKDPAQRAAYLDNVCGDNPRLRAEIEDLLAHDEQAGSFLESPPPGVAVTVDNQPDAERPGSLIGRYKLLQEIGEGGMGTVFMAEQLEPVKRRVAVKIIKRGMDSRQFIARFEAERQALALMDHPNIARVLDAGCTETGRPYFVMELVKGVPIHMFCDENKLTAQQRLELFVSVCQAVQHAHQKGIIHRDLKPSNVLVALYDDRPVPKIIDFGVAKAAHQQLTEKTLFTQIGQIVGTWEYMSPEQAVLNQLDVDTRTDIYSLGVILYELLTGVTPLESSRLRSAALDEMLRLIREEEPPKPSTRVSTLGDRATAAAAYRGTSAPSLAKTLRGDLDWIVMKALEKNRARRYDTAKDLADDVHRYLTNQPVEARAPSTLYRLQKFVHRHRAAAVTIAVVAAALVAATVFSTWMAVRELRARELMQVAMEDAEQERQRAEEEAQKSRKAAADAELAMEVIAAAVGGGEGKRLGSPDQKVSEMLDGLSKRLDARPDRNVYVEAILRPVIAKGYWNLKQWEAARVQYRHAVEAQRRVYGELDARTADSLNSLSIACANSAHAGEAEECVRQSMAIWKALEGGDRPAALTLSGLVEALRLQGKFKEALDTGNTAIPLLRKVYGDASPATAWCIAHVAECHGALGDTEKKIAGMREALAIFERARELDGQFEMRMGLGHALYSQRKFLDSKDAFSHALKLSEHLGALRVQRRHDATVFLSNVLFDLRDYQAAEKLHRDFLRTTEEHFDKSDPRLLEHQGALACALAGQGKEQEAGSMRRELLSLLDSQGQYQLWMRLGHDLRRRGKLFDARDAFSRALRLSDGFDLDKVDLRNGATSKLRDVLCDLRDYEAAETPCREFIRYARGKLDDDNRRVVSKWIALAWALHDQGKETDAEAIFLQVGAVMRRALDDRRIVWSGLWDRLSYAEAVGMSRRDQASLREATSMLAEVQREADQDAFSCSYWHSVSAEIASRLGQKEEAIRHARISVDKAPLDYLDYQQAVVGALVRLLRGAGRLQEAQTVLRKALADHKGKFGDDHVITNYARADLAEFLIDVKKYTEAEGLLQQAQKALLSDLRVPASQRQRIVRLLGNLYEAWGKPEQASLWRAKLDKAPASEPNKPAAKAPSGK